MRQAPVYIVLRVFCASGRKSNISQGKNLHDFDYSRRTGHTLYNVRPVNDNAGMLRQEDTYRTEGAGGAIG